MVIDYCVIDADTIEQLTQIVKARLKEGWQPQGGIAFLRFVVIVMGREQSRYMYLQALVKTDDTPS